MKFKIKIMIIVSFVVIVSMSLFIVHNNPVSVSSIQPDNVITGSNNSYLITLKGVPSGNGTYQQLITINNYSKYGINGEGSNIAFYDGNNLTHLYAWIQSINITTIQIWVKNYNDSSKIDMQVLFKDENLFSVDGYLGEAPQLSPTYAEYDNGYIVFNGLYTNFTSLNEICKNFNTPFTGNGLGGGGVYSNDNYTINNGLTFWNNGYNASRSAGGVENGISVIGSYNYSRYIEYVNGYSSPTNISYADSSILGGYDGSYRVLTEFMLDNGYYAYILNTTKPMAKEIFGVSNNISTFYTLSMTYRQPDLILGVNNTLYYVNNSQGYPVGLSSSDYNSEVYQIYIINTTADRVYMHLHYWFLADNIQSGMPSFTITLLYYSIDFKLLGSPFSLLWNIMVNGTTYQADSSNLYLNMTNGWYNIIVNLPAGYSAITKGVLYVNGTNQVYKIFVSYNNNSGISNDIIYAIILASIIVAAAIYFSKRS